MGAGIDVLPAPLQSCAANQRKKLEHLCRYITRPAIANERLALNRAGQVVLTLTEDTLPRWHDLYRDVTAGIRTTTRRAGSPSAVGSHSLPWWVLTKARSQHRALSPCGGSLTIIAAIEPLPVIAKILAHLGLPARAPPRSSAPAFDRFQMAF